MPISRMPKVGSLPKKIVVPPKKKNVTIMPVKPIKKATAPAKKMY